MSWNESEHPRDEDGKFTDGNKTRWITTKRDYSNVQGGEGKHLQSDGGSGTINLTKQEWAQYYKILGDEQHGDFVYHSYANERWVRLDNKIIIDDNDFVSPTVKDVLYYEDNDALNDAINQTVERGIIR
ncbi:MAG: hypothetical protein ACI4MZ_01370 [Christensenellales bacterium]